MEIASPCASRESVTRRAFSERTPHSLDVRGVDARRKKEAMSKKLAAAALAILAAMPAPEIRAAEPPTLEPGRLVRIWTVGSSSPEFEGTVLTLEDATITLNIAGRTTRAVVSRDKIARLDLSGRHSRGRGALIGAAAGTFLGASVGLALGDDDPKGFIALTGEGKAIILGTLSAIVGVIVGAIVRPQQKWTKVSADRFKLNVALPRGGGVGASVSLGF
jgi:hypothetical protein